MSEEDHPAEAETPATHVEASPQEIMPEVTPDPELIDRVALGRHARSTTHLAEPVEPDDLESDA